MNPLRLQRMASTALFWAMVLTSFALVFAVAVLPALRRGLAMDVKLAELRRANSELAQRVQALEKERWALENDAFFVEKLARRMLRLQRPGEMRVSSIQPRFENEEPRAEQPEGVPPSILVDLMQRLDPLATNQAIRLIAVCLALVNLLAAFMFFGQTAHEVPTRPRQSGVQL